MEGRSLKIGILTVSDSCFAGIAEDKSGANLRRLIEDSKILNGAITEQEIVPDKKYIIVGKLCEWSDERGVDLILTTGGTGCAPTDVTPEATRSVIEREIPGLSVAMLTKSLEITPLAMLARPVCGIRNKTVIINLPGNLKGSQECLEIVAPVVQHVIDLINDCKSNVERTHRGLQSSSSSSHHTTSSCHTDKDHSGHHHHLLHHQHHHQHQHQHHLQHHHHQQHQHHHQQALEKSGVNENAVARRHRESPYPMVTVEQAVNTVLNHICTADTESVSLADALHRVLAEDVFAADPLPPFPASIKDGYAVIASDGAGVRKVLGDSTAGAEPSTRSQVVPGSCVRVSTGAPVPSGSDAVVQVEDTKLISASEDGSTELEVEILLAPSVRQDIREVGSDIRAGEKILSGGMKLGPSELGLLATVGVTEVKCYALPRVGVMSTGNELVEPGAVLSEGKIRDSNRTVLISCLRENSFNPQDLGIARDTAGELLKQVTDALEKVDYIVTSGGVSMGEKSIFALNQQPQGDYLLIKSRMLWKLSKHKYLLKNKMDLLKDILTVDLKATIHFARVQMKPGKPTTFATFDWNGRKKIVFGLPGNPVSSAVTCQLYVLPALRKHCGEAQPRGTIIKAQIKEDVTLDPRPEYHRCVLDWCTDSGVPVALSTGNQISSRLLSLRSANGLLVLPARTESVTALKAGSLVDCILMCPRG